MNGRYRIIKTDEIIISRNIIKFDDVIIQLRNISSVDITTKPKKDLLLSTIVFLAGMILGIMGYGGVWTLLGFMAALFSGVELYKRAVHNASVDRFLFICMNSTYMYGIAAVQPLFLREIKEQMEYCMNHNYEETIVIDLKNSRMNDKSDIEGK